jgi:hypothetical protein
VRVPRFEENKIAKRIGTTQLQTVQHGVPAEPFVSKLNRNSRAISLSPITPPFVPLPNLCKPLARSVERVLTARVVGHLAPR